MTCVCNFLNDPNCPVHGVPPSTLFELIQKTRPEVLKVWDKWDYKIYAPLSLDDEPFVEVHLINKNKSKVGFRFSLYPILQEVVQHGSDSSSRTEAVQGTRVLGKGKV